MSTSVQYCDKINQSEITLLEAIEGVQSFLPIKVVFNDIILYNDYDSSERNDDGSYGETQPPMSVIPRRCASALERYDVFVDSIDIRVVQHHHSIVYLTGRKVEKNG